MSVIGMHRGRRGFTLLELMITIVIVAVLMAIATPSMRKLIVKHRVQDAATDVFVTLLKARSEALKRNANISVRPATGGWANGWNIPDPADSTKFLDQHQPLSQISVAFTGLTSLPTYPVYNSSGRINNGLPSFVLSVSGGGYSCSYTVSVDASGRPYETSTGYLGTKTAGGGAPTC